MLPAWESADCSGTPFLLPSSALRTGPEYAIGMSISVPNRLAVYRPGEPLTIVRHSFLLDDAVVDHDSPHVGLEARCQEGNTGVNALELGEEVLVFPELFQPYLVSRITEPPDEDGDGEADPTDACMETGSEVVVDDSGCSLTQFCASIDTSTRIGVRTCRESDWMNDEPLTHARDCSIDRLSGLCVPGERRSKRGVGRVVPQHR